MFEWIDSWPKEGCPDIGQESLRIILLDEPRSSIARLCKRDAINNNVAVDQNQMIRMKKTTTAIVLTFFTTMSATVSFAGVEHQPASILFDVKQFGAVGDGKNVRHQGYQQSN